MAGKLDSIMKETFNPIENIEEVTSEVFREDMTDADVDDLRELRIHLSQQRGNWEEASNEKVLDDFFWSNAHSYVIREDLGETTDTRQRIVATGQLDLSKEDKIGVVEHIVAHPDMRGRGLGRKIMERVIKGALENGLEKLVLTSNPTREAAHGLYKSLGFQIIGEKQKYDEDEKPTHKTSLFELDLTI